MSTTTAASSTSAATTATGDASALTTAFTPPARCTQTSLMFGMLAPRSEIWINEPVPYHNVNNIHGPSYRNGVVDRACDDPIGVPAELGNGHDGSRQLHRLLSTVKTTHWPVLRLRWMDIVQAGGTCYSDLSSGQVLTQVTQYNDKSISATIPFTATAAGAQVYAHPMDGYSAQEAQVTVFHTANSHNATTTSPATLASATQSTTAAPDSSSGSGLSGGAIAGVVIGVLAGVALLAALIFFLLRRRWDRSAQPTPLQLEDEEMREIPETPAETKTAVVAEIYGPGRNELGTDRGVDAELSGEAREPAELDAEYSSTERR
ncbi:hypothetical protein M409DRAFT_27637 [Zasmidium cellare ATCC 36951]|uniref:Uncharacterized protein n=1 Tax=Zasmidium cellare ATCC 36951 TaxID=1080233 RepID=A0A6A6C6T9_ZASCE|nr:uncharacterized protein M409DRAFT_27637 [Zasmidium cellare ATCC 36951]KAF2161910.1 hypothetical protein M409DRAFT_27637 [Zasmidium cellare ATCC 36951]